MLDKGLESFGAARRAFDKFGKRMWKATPMMDNSNHRKTLGTPSVKSSQGVGSNQVRSKTF